MRKRLKRELVIEVFNNVSRVYNWKHWLINQSFTACRPIDMAIRLFDASNTPMCCFFGLGSKHPAVSIYWHHFSFSFFSDYRPSNLPTVFFLCSHFTVNAFHASCHWLREYTLQIKQKWRRKKEREREGMNESTDEFK